MIDIHWEQKSSKLSCHYAWQPGWAGTISVIAVPEDIRQEVHLETLMSSNASQAKTINCSKLTPGRRYRILCRMGESEIPLEKECIFVVPYNVQVNYFPGKLRKDGWQEIFIRVQGVLPSGSLAINRGSGYKFPLPLQPKANEICRYWFQVESEDQAKLSCLVPVKASPKLVHSIKEL